jgi:O-antigen ligase
MLFQVLAYLSIFIVVIHHYRSGRQVRSIVHTVIAMGCILVIFAVIQKMTWNGKLYWIVPVAPGIDSNMTFIWGSFINHNHFAGYLEMAAPMGMGMLLYRSASRIESDRESPRKRLMRFLSGGSLAGTTVLTVAVLLMASGIFLSLSRGGIMGLTASSLFFFLLARTRRSLRKRTSAVLLVGLAVAVLVVAAAWGRISNRFGELRDTSRIMRAQVWTDALDLLGDYPVLGTGAGTFDSVFPRYQTRYTTFRFEHAENDYLETATDLGIAGLTLFLALVVSFFGTTVKLWRQRKNTFVTCMTAGSLASCVAIAVHGATDFNLRIPANAMLLTVAAATAYATVKNVHSREGSVHA